MKLFEEFEDKSKSSNQFKNGSERTLNQLEDAQAYDNMVEVAGLLTSTSINNWVYEVEDCYLDYGQRWMWTTIICHDNEGDTHQVLNPAEWVQICNAKSDEELKQIVDSIKADEYFQDRDRSVKEDLNNPLKDAQNKAKKKQKGMSLFSYLNPDAGDVETGVAAFNHAMGNSCEGGECMGESLDGDLKKLIAEEREYAESVRADLGDHESVYYWVVEADEEGWEELTDQWFDIKDAIECADRRLSGKRSFRFKNSKHCWVERWVDYEPSNGSYDDEPESEIDVVYDPQGYKDLEENLTEDINSEDTVEYNKRAVEREYGLEDGELDSISIRDAEKLIGEEDGALDRFINNDDEDDWDYTEDANEILDNAGIDPTIYDIYNKYLNNETYEEGEPEEQQAILDKYCAALDDAFAEIKGFTCDWKEADKFVKTCNEFLAQGYELSCDPEVYDAEEGSLTDDYSIFAFKRHNRVDEDLTENYKEYVHEQTSTQKGFYIGDICYALDDDTYDTVWGGANYVDGKYDVNGYSFIVGSTAYGDGEYTDQHSNVYGVDAGNIGIVPLELCTGDSEDNLKRLGNVLYTTGVATFECENGIFDIVTPNETIHIDTAGSAYDDDDE